MQVPPAAPPGGALSGTRRSARHLILTQQLTAAVGKVSRPAAAQVTSDSPPAQAASSLEEVRPHALQQRGVVKLVGWPALVQVAAKSTKAEQMQHCSTKARSNRAAAL